MGCVPKNGEAQGGAWGIPPSPPGLTRFSTPAQQAGRRWEIWDAPLQMKCVDTTQIWDYPLAKFLKKHWLKALKPLNRIQNKLLIAFLIVVLLPLIGTGLYGNWITSRVLQNSALNNAKNETTQQAERITAFLDNAQEDILFLSELGSLRSLIAARAAEDADEIARRRQQVEQDFTAFSDHRGI